MGTVVIGCKLPHGLIIEGQSGKKIKLNGMNTSVVSGGHGITRVDENEAAIFFATHADFAPVKSGAIFYNQSDSDADVAAMAKELAGVKTGFEGLDPSAPAPGLKAEDGQAMDDSKLAKPLPKAKKEKV